MAGSDSLSIGTALADIAAAAGQLGDLKSDRIVQAFERQILSGRLPAGARLPTEDELCRILGVSRSVVRDAVRILVARGLLTVRQGRGTAVAEPSDASYSNAMLGLLTRFGLTMGQVFEARATIETSLVGLAAKNGTPDDWAALDAAYKALSEAVARDDRAAAINSHARIHAQILEAVHQPALLLMLRPMSDLTIASAAGSVRPGVQGDWEVEMHEPILAALKASDPDEAIRAMAAHYELSTRPVPHYAVMDRPFAEAYYGDDSV